MRAAVRQRLVASTLTCGAPCVHRVLDSKITVLMSGADPDCLLEFLQAATRNKVGRREGLRNVNAVRCTHRLALHMHTHSHSHLCELQKRARGIENISPRSRSMKRMRHFEPSGSVTEEQRRILELIQRGENVFFTGSAGKLKQFSSLALPSSYPDHTLLAGTGKSFLLKEIIRMLPKRTTHVTAATGIAACPLGQLLFPCALLYSPSHQPLPLLQVASRCNRLQVLAGRVRWNVQCSAFSGGSMPSRGACHALHA